MRARRRTTWLIPGLLGLGATAGLAAIPGCGGGEPNAPLGKTTITRRGDAPAEGKTTPLGDKLRGGDLPTLATLAKSLEGQPAGSTRPLTEADGEGWADAIAGLRNGYEKFPGTQARAAAIGTSIKIIEKFAVEPGPASWPRTLAPVRDLIESGLTSIDPDIRVAALSAAGHVWNWYPARPILPIEERILGEWKDSIHATAVRQLAHPQAKVRVAAVAALGKSPIDRLAAPAAAYVDDPKSGDVRAQVLASFAERPDLLTDEMLLHRLHDSVPVIRQLAEFDLLNVRHLTKDQVALGRMVTSPKPEMRASVIPLLKDHEDLDPVVWLLRLSNDPDEGIRIKAVEAMTGKDSPDLRARLREMAAKDASQAVRASASRLVAASGGSETISALPPLPGSPSLTPKAN